jgi:hypothetical protein
MKKPNAKTFGSGAPGDLAAQFRERERMSDASPGGSPRLAMDYPKRERGEGAGRPLNRERAVSDFHLLGTGLFGEEIKADTNSVLRERFEFPPFSVLNAREGPWQERKRAWIACGIQSELGRGATPTSCPNSNDNLPDGAKGLSAGLANNQGRSKELIPNGMGRTSKLRYGCADLRASMTDEQWAAFKASEPCGGGGPNSGYTRGRVNANTSSSNTMQYAGGFEDSSAGTSGTSIFDPVLTELAYRWFAPPGGLILDPFSGGSVRGIIAGLLGYRYYGIDLRSEQIAANEQQRQHTAPDADITWHCGDSNILLTDAPLADFVFSCPPYGDLERYSDDPSDISTMSWTQFTTVYQSIIQQAIARLKPNRFACFVVGEFRNTKTGMYRGFVPLTIAAFEAAGAAFYNEAILLTAVGSLPIRVSKMFESSRKLGKTHQQLLVFCKGDPRLATDAIRGVQATEPAPVAGSLARPEDAPRPKPSAPLPAAKGPSALAFAFRQTGVGAAEAMRVQSGEPLPAVLSAPEPPEAPSLPAVPEPVLSQPEQPESTFDASTFAINLKARGHRLLTRDGKFFVSEASRLTDEDRAAIKQHREALIALAEPWGEAVDTAGVSRPAAMTVGSLFAGIGGFDLGFERAGCRVKWQVEINPFCQKVLAKHWPHVKRYSDVQRVEAELGYVDIICGGFPCQDISLAGAGEGIDEGEQSGLWREYIRLVRLLRPRYILVENVTALLLRGVHRVLGDLAESGYDAEWDCLPASAFGAPHRRDRIWLVAYPRQERAERVFQGALSRFSGFSWCQDVRGVEDLRRRSDLPPSIFRGARDGIPDWVDRVGACGNAVVPDVVEWIARRITECDRLCTEARKSATVS